MGKEKWKTWSDQKSRCEHTTSQNSDQDQNGPEAAAGPKFPSSHPHPKKRSFSLSADSRIWPRVIFLPCGARERMGNERMKFREGKRFLVALQPWVRGPQESKMKE